MVLIVSSSSAPLYLQQYREWVDVEWGDVDSFEGVHKDFVVPAPLLAVEGETLIGGLSFSSFPVPGREEIAVWINTVLVAPEHRGAGIASQLVKAADIEAASINVKEMFVYTDFPELYQKLGWSIVDNSGESIVLQRHGF